MNRTERLYRIDQLISERRVVSRSDLLDALEVSPATLKRDLEYLRNRLNAPIVWCRDSGGYRFDQSTNTGAQYELPGLWFSDKEIHALLTMQHLLANLDPGGILAPHVQPLVARLNALLGSAENTADEIRCRVLIVGIGKRSMKLAHFENIGSALLRRKRLAIRYYARGRDEESEREISPQRLVMIAPSLDGANSPGADYGNLHRPRPARTYRRADSPRRSGKDVCHHQARQPGLHRSALRRRPARKRGADLTRDHPLTRVDQPPPRPAHNRYFKLARYCATASMLASPSCATAALISACVRSPVLLR